MQLSNKGELPPNYNAGSINMTGGNLEPEKRDAIPPPPKTDHQYRQAVPILEIIN